MMLLHEILIKQGQIRKPQTLPPGSLFTKILLLSMMSCHFIKLFCEIQLAVPVEIPPTMILLTGWAEKKKQQQKKPFVLLYSQNTGVLSAP